MKEWYSAWLRITNRSMEAVKEDTRTKHGTKPDKPTKTEHIIRQRDTGENNTLITKAKKTG